MGRVVAGGLPGPNAGVRLIRFHHPLLRAGSCELGGEEHTHLARVLRLKPGAQVELFDGQGLAAAAEVVSVERRRTLLEVAEPRAAAPAPWSVTACVATPKAKRAKRLVEALTELGVTEFVPLLAERGESRPPQGAELERWALEACKQCWRDRLPVIGAPQTPAQVAQRVALGGALGLLPDTLAAPPLRAVLPPEPRPLLFVVGPEGGFSPAEREALASALLPVSLGPLVLRVETAAQALVAGAAALWAASKAPDAL